MATSKRKEPPYVPMATLSYVGWEYDDGVQSVHVTEHHEFSETVRHVPEALVEQYQQAQDEARKAGERLLAAWAAAPEHPNPKYEPPEPTEDDEPMSLRSYEAEILASLRHQTGNRKLRQKDIKEWSTSPIIGARSTETVVFLADMKVHVAYELPPAKPRAAKPAP